MQQDNYVPNTPIRLYYLTDEDLATVIDALRDIPEIDSLMVEYRQSRQDEIDYRLALAQRLEDQR